ncbi:predicted protein [Naegleria gruberi]|uniref:Exonuclease 1 n=1 Tax=Naegleria gruberi TaxID=5762 RepID=D2V4C4_NAEGR|nr:uncharacterized protein NAEGRDRAFT_30993 [Naegleria gruberi]EFC48360.1 predicted protein [Naegleria gruberi]|eukprot:XP_002681104.1 predicted protein [Naegleria gruberi strain NEG-M]
MGIQGLLPLFKNHCKKGHVSELKGQKVAIDAYVWLHRGAYSCSAELCQNKPTDKYLGYCMHMVNMLKHNKVIPVLVFDGARLPSKADTESDRRSRRKEALEQAQIHLQNHRYEQANECFRKAVDIKPSMAYQLISQCKKEGVEIVVAPYEADAQLAHLARTGYVSCVITEDSDLIPYGAPKIFFKMDKYGHGTLLNLADINHTPTANGSTDFSKFTHDMMMRMCILSGCDYLSSLSGIGPKTAYKIIKENRTVPKIMEALRKLGKFKRQENTQPKYREAFVRAELTFKHQRVFDILSQEMRCLTDPPSCLTEEDIYFCGPTKPTDIVVQICTGMIDPMSHKPFVSAPSYASKSSVSFNSFSYLTCILEFNTTKNKHNSNLFQ